MNFTFSTAMDHNGHKSGIIKEGAINELGEVTYTKDDHYDENHYPSFEEIVANEVLKRIYGVDQCPMNKLKDEAFERSRERYGLPSQKKEQDKAPVSMEAPKRPVNQKQSTELRNDKQNIVPETIKIGVNIKELTDDEFIEFTKKRVQSNKDFERFKSIKAKIRSTLEGRTHNEKAFDLFVKLHEIDKRGFFNRSKEDDELITEAIRLYGSV